MQSIEAYRKRRREYQRRYALRTVGKYYRLKKNAKERGVVFNINRDDFLSWYETTRKHCHYCKRPLRIEQGYQGLDCPNFERRDNNGGYEISNLVLSCRKCNLIKGSWFSESQMLEIAGEYL